MRDKQNNYLLYSTKELLENIPLVKFICETMSRAQMGYDIDQVISYFLTVTVSTNSEFAHRNLNSGLNIEFYYLSVLISKLLF